MNEERGHSLVLRVSREELDMAHAVAQAEDRSISAVVRRLVRETYVTRFGEMKPPRARLKHSK